MSFSHFSVSQMSFYLLGTLTCSWIGPKVTVDRQLDVGEVQTSESDQTNDTFPEQDNGHAPPSPEKSCHYDARVTARNYDHGFGHFMHLIISHVHPTSR